jgi:hypothetical protein
MIDLNPEIDIKLITNNQNQNRISSFLTVLWSSILDNAMWKNSSYIIYYILEFFFYCPWHKIEKSSEPKDTRIGSIDASFAFAILKARRHRLSDEYSSNILHLLEILRALDVSSSQWICKKSVKNWPDVFVRTNDQFNHPERCLKKSTIAINLILFMIIIQSYQYRPFLFLISSISALNYINWKNKSNLFSLEFNR